MQWIAFLVLIFLALGLTERRTGGSTHLTILVVTTFTLVAVFLHLGSIR